MTDRHHLAPVSPDDGQDPRGALERLHPGGFTHVPMALMLRPNHKPGHVAVYAAIASGLRPQRGWLGRLWNRRVAERAGYAPSSWPTVNRYLRDLERWGYIRTDAVPGLGKFYELQTTSAEALAQVEQEIHEDEIRRPENQAAVMPTDPSRVSNTPLSRDEQEPVALAAGDSIDVVDPGRSRVDKPAPTPKRADVHLADLDHCRRCGRDVERFTPDGVPWCDRCLDAEFSDEELRALMAGRSVVGLTGDYPQYREKTP